LDHLQNTASLKVDKLRYLVMDEADRLLDMGFERDVTQIVKTLDEKVREKAELDALAAEVMTEGSKPQKTKNAAGDEKKSDKPRRQTALISATLNSDIKRLMGSVMRSEPVYVSVTKVHEQLAQSNAKDATAAKKGNSSSPAAVAVAPQATKDKEEVSIEQKDDTISTPRGLDQSYAVVPCKKRLVTLAAFLQWQAKTKCVL
jgi:ATP-dependent RNA helicase DDX31/DBP7